jgi:hypothetical protein
MIAPMGMVLADEPDEILLGLGVLERMRLMYHPAAYLTLIHPLLFLRQTLITEFGIVFRRPDAKNKSGDIAQETA